MTIFAFLLCFPRVYNFFSIILHQCSLMVITSKGYSLQQILERDLKEIDQQSNQLLLGFPVIYPSTAPLLKAMTAVSDSEKWSLRLVTFLHLK